MSLGPALLPVQYHGLPVLYDGMHTESCDGGGGGKPDPTFP